MEPNVVPNNKGARASQATISSQRNSVMVPYVKKLEKLPSLGPLSIEDYNSFLIRSKIDFQNSYKDKSMSDLKITDFLIIRKLGSGSFGKVILAQFIREDTLYAIKVIDKRAVIKGNHFQYVHNEKRVLQSLNFPFVVYLKYFFVDFNFLYFVMPYIPGGDFFEYLQEHKPLSESLARFYVSQLVLALEYLHFLELIHRDVKPENIMLDAFGYIKLADFGQCTRCSGTDKAWTHTGTPEYMAPEIIKGLGYDFGVDWWALGTTLYEMCAGRRPFKHSNSNKLYQMILQMKFDVPDMFSKNLQNLVRLLMTASPEKRLGHLGANSVKQHPWFRHTDWHKVLNRSLPAPFLPTQKPIIIEENEV